jgi:peptide/nickel transport system permease protein
MGIIGLGIILFFLIVALIAPLISPWPQPIRVNLAPRLSAPMWLLPLNPVGFDSRFPIENSHFNTDASGWTYGESVNGEGYIVINNSRFDNSLADNYWSFSGIGAGMSIVSNFHNPNIGSTAQGGSDAGCYEMQFNDSSSTLSYGDTHVYLEYSFLFNESRYPVGFVTSHPTTVVASVSYQSVLEELGAASDMLFIVEVSNSSGIPANIYSRRIYLTGTSSWISRPSETMGTVNMTSTFAGTDIVTVGVHVVFRNPFPLDTPKMIMRVDDVQLAIRSQYTDPTDNHLMTGQHSATEGGNLTGPGCFQFTFEDTRDDTFYLRSTAWIEHDFTWDVLERPKEAYINYLYKIESIGDWGDAFVNIIQEVYVENTGNTIQVLRADNIWEDVDWTPSPIKVMDAFMLRDTFDERGTLWARIRVEVSDPTPEDTPIIAMYFDDCEIEILGNYFGLLGAGQYGEDLWSQLLWGSRIAMVVGMSAAAISVFVGLIVGLISGYFGGIIDEILMRVTDFFLVIPGLPLMIVLAAILTPHWWNIVLVIALVGWTGTARLVRSQVLAERQKAYVEAARAIGASDLYIIFRHILPNVTPLLFAQITLRVAGAILSEAGLSFLGLTHPHDVSWGRMLFQASGAGAYSEGAWWYVFFPGLCIVLLSLSFTLVGYAVDEILNPRLRIRRQ